MTANNIHRFQERTFTLIKPDGLHRGLVGKIVQRLERKGLKLVGMKMVKAERDVFTSQYKEMQDKDFFKDMIEYLLSGPVIAMVWEGQCAVSAGRDVIGGMPPYSVPGTIRGDYAMDIVMNKKKGCHGNVRNMIHGSDTVEEAKREIGLWFQPHELMNWKYHMTAWIY